MKNTELVRVQGIMNYKEELNKVKPVEQEKYTIKEAAQYFGCASSQVKGYITNYKDVFGDMIRKESTATKPKEIITISADGMFLLALLLGKRSRVSEKVFNIVNEKVEADAPKQIAMEEIAKEEIAATAEEKVTTDNIIDFNELKERKAKKKEEEMIEVPSIEMTENGPEIVMKKISKAEHEKRVEEAKEAVSSLFSKIAESIEEQEEEEQCNCPECLEEEFNTAMHMSKLAMLEAKTTLGVQLEITKSYKEICSLLSIDDLDASIMIQGYIVNGEGDLDNIIFNYLVNQKRENENRNVGALHHSMELLATEKFNESKEDAYIHFANELKYVIGKDLTELVVKEEYEKLLTEVVRANAYTDAQNIIFTLLAE